MQAFLYFSMSQKPLKRCGVVACCNVKKLSHARRTVNEISKNLFLTEPRGLLLGHEHPQGVVVVVVVAVEELGQAHAHVGQHGPVGGRGEDAEGSRQQLHRGHG